MKDQQLLPVNVTTFSLLEQIDPIIGSYMYDASLP